MNSPSTFAKPKNAAPVIAVIVPCYKEKTGILDVLARMPASASLIFCIDDRCPQKTGDHIEAHCSDARVSVIRHDVNRGVGGAVKTGYEAALAAGADIMVKIDGDGQMDPAALLTIAAPVLSGRADYAKGNRFYQLDYLETMPAKRLIGNALLSFLTKLSTGYWTIFDPTNGYTAIHRTALAMLPLDKIDERYFFESDMLFRLGTIRAVVQDVPMRAHYGNETSTLSVRRAIPDFAAKHLRNFFKRIGYNYWLRDFSVASLEWLAGPLLMLFGTVFGMSVWVTNAGAGVGTAIGTVMIVALSLIMGTQFTLSALQYDVFNQPRIPLQANLSERVRRSDDGAGQ